MDENEHDRNNLGRWLREQLAVARALAGLRPDLRATLLLLFWVNPRAGRLTQHAAGEILGVDQSTVGRRKDRALSQLQSRLRSECVRDPLLRDHYYEMPLPECAETVPLDVDAVLWSFAMAMFGQLSLFRLDYSPIAFIFLAMNDGAVPANVQRAAEALGRDAMDVHSLAEKAEGYAHSIIRALFRGQGRHELRIGALPEFVHSCRRAITLSPELASMSAERVEAELHRLVKNTFSFEDSPGELNGDA